MEVVLGDMMGDLLCMLGVVDVVFIGGSLVLVGGYNMLEFLVMGILVFMGFYVFNFQVVVDLFFELDVLCIVFLSLGLGQVVVILFNDSEVYKILVDCGR